VPEDALVFRNIQHLLEPSGHQEFGASRISRLSAYEGGKVVSPTHRLPLPQ